MPSQGQFAKIGVEMVVEGARQFQDQMNQGNKSIASFGGAVDGLGRVFRAVTAPIRGFLGVLRDMAVVAGGILIRDAINFIIGGLRQMAAEALRAGAEFQRLTIRLETNIARQLVAASAVTTTSSHMRDATLTELALREELIDKIERQTRAVRELTREQGANAIETRLAQQELQQLNTQLEALGINQNNMVSVTESSTQTTLAFGEALDQATERADDLFLKLAQLSIVTPFDLQDISNVFSMAVAFGFAEDESLELTKAIADFAAGMGLSAVQMERIIINLGQMESLGKVTQREMRDLAIGSFVPVNDILEIMAENLGVTVEQIHKMRLAGTLAADEFNKAFIQMIETDFVGAARRANLTIDAVIQNLRDLFVNLIAFKVIKPVLDQVAQALQPIIEGLGQDPRFIRGLEMMGEGLAGILELLLGLVPSTEGVIDIIAGKFVWLGSVIKSIGAGDFEVAAIKFLKGLGLEFEEVWRIIQLVKDAFADFQDEGLFAGLSTLFEGLGAGPDTITFFDNIQQGIENIKTFWDENKEEILGIVNEILAAFGIPASEGAGGFAVGLSEGFVNFTQGLIDNAPKIIETLEGVKTFITETFLPALDNLGEFLGEHGGTILQVALSFMILSAAISGIANLVLTVAGFFLGLGAAVLFVNVVMDVLALIFGVSLVFLLPLVAAVLILIYVWQEFGEAAMTTAGQLRDIVVAAIEYVWGTLSAWVENMQEASAEIGRHFGEMVLAGRRFMLGLIQGIQGAIEAAKDIAGQVVQGIIDRISRIGQWLQVGLDAIRAVARGFVMAGQTIWTTLSGIIRGAWDKLRQMKWIQAGTEWVEGIITGITEASEDLKQALLDIASDGLKAFLAFFGIKSPATLMIPFGMDIVGGLAKGINQATGMMQEAMGGMSFAGIESAANIVAAPAVAGVTNNNVNNAFNLNIATNAPSEPIIQDFELMRSMAGATGY